MKIIINNKSDAPLYHATCLVTEIISKGLPYQKFYDYKVNDKSICCVVRYNMDSVTFNVYNQ